MPARYRALLADQALYAASNLLAVVLAGRGSGGSGPDGVDGTAFGQAMLAFLALSLITNASRAVWSEPELAGVGAGSGPAGCRPETARILLRPGRGVALTASMAAAVLLTTGAGLVGGLGAAVAVVLQDRIRSRHLIQGRAGRAVLSDGLWLAWLTGWGLAGEVGAVALDPGRVLRLWALGAVVGALAALTCEGPAMPHRRTGGQRSHTPTGGPAATGRAATWPAAGAASVPPTAVALAPPPVAVAPAATRRRRGLFLADFLLQSGATQLAGLALGLVLAGPAYGELRAAITLLGPVGVANTALTTQILGGRDGSRAQVGCIVSLAAAAVGLLVAVPRTLGTGLLGAAWPGRATVVLIGATVATQTLSGRWLTRLKRDDRRRALLAVRAGGAAGLSLVTMSLAVRWSRADVVAGGYLVVNMLVAVVAGRAAAGTRSSGWRIHRWWRR